MVYFGLCMSSRWGLTAQHPIIANLKNLLRASQAYDVTLEACLPIVVPP